VAAIFSNADRQDDSMKCRRVTDDDDLNQNMDVVDKATVKLRPKNSNDKYRPTILEFKSFWSLRYAGEGYMTVTLRCTSSYVTKPIGRRNRRAKKY
jgi:hypothetical protein